jgi:DNA-binding response OmpR family regulator
MSEQRKPGHILVVDDEAPWRTTLARVLRQEGYMVTEANDGETVINLLNSSTPDSIPFDVIVTDIVMGYVDGVQVTNVARAHPDDPEVIVLTGYGSLDSSIACLRAGAFDYLFKPTSMASILERVSDAFSHHVARKNLLRQSEMLDKIGGLFEEYQQEGNKVSSRNPEPPTPPAPEPPAPEPPAPEPPAPDAPDRFMTVGEILIDTHNHRVFFQEKVVHTTRTEYFLLVCLANHVGYIVSYEDIVRCTYADRSEKGDPQTLLRQHVHNLRQKFDSSYFINVYGTGYMLVDPGLST